MQYIAFVYVISLTSLAFSIYAMVSIYLYVRSIEDRLSQYEFTDTQEAASRLRSRAVGIQGIFYADVTAVGGLPLVFAAIYTLIMGVPSLFLDTVGSVMFTLIDTFNMMVIFRIRTVMHTAYGRFIQRILTAMGITLRGDDRQAKTSDVSSTEQGIDLQQFASVELVRPASDSQITI